LPVPAGFPALVFGRFFHSPAFHRGDLNNSAKAVQLNTQLSQGSAATDLWEDVDLI